MNTTGGNGMFGNIDGDSDRKTKKQAQLRKKLEDKKRITS